MPVKNGWTLFFHPLFINQVDELATLVASHKKKDPANYQKKNASKRLAAINKLTMDVIPQNPEQPVFRQEGTLGNTHKHWFRAKFFQKYRLFFRFHTDSKIIIYAWVNDEHNKRAYASKTDAYRIFEKMLNDGHPPNDWDSLLNESTKSKHG